MHLHQHCMERAPVQKKIDEKVGVAKSTSSLLKSHFFLAAQRCREVPRSASDFFRILTRIHADFHENRCGFLSWIDWLELHKMACTPHTHSMHTDRVPLPSLPLPLSSTPPPQILQESLPRDGSDSHSQHKLACHQLRVCGTCAMSELAACVQS